MTIDQINALGDAAVNSIAAGDYAGALNNLNAAAAALAFNPDMSDSSGRSLRYDRMSLASMIQNVTRMAGAKRGIQTSKINYHRPTYCDDD